MKKIFKTSLIFGTVVFAAVAAMNFSMNSFAQETPSSPPGRDTTSAVAAAQWSDNTAITFDQEANTFRFQSNGIPDHGFAKQYLIPNDVASQPFNDNSAKEFTVVNSADYFTQTNVDSVITTRPKYTDKTTLTSLGRIGVTISGVQMFNDYENMERSIVALDDNVIHNDVPFVDECNGHTLIDGSNYHYHGIPTCITDKVDRVGEHSVMIGVLEDGFPITGNLGPGGRIVTNADLDACSGHFGKTPEFPEGIYHYHLSADEAPYSIDCYHGEIDASAKGGGPERPDFAAVAQKLGVSEAALLDALGTSRPPNFEAASAALGVSVEDIKNAMPPPPR